MKNTTVGGDWQKTLDGACSITPAQPLPWPPGETGSCRSHLRARSETLI